MFFRSSGNKKLRKKSAGIVLNVKVSRSRKMRKFFSSSAVKKIVVLVSFTAVGVFGVMVSVKGMETFFKDPRYQVSEIDVYTQEFFTQKELLGMSGIAVGMYPFDFSVKKAAQEIEKNPNVKRASVERMLPNKVVIKVVERAPIAVVLGKPDFMVDEDGVLLPLRPEIPVGMVSITGAKLNEEEVGHNISTEAMGKAINLLHEYQHTDLPLSLEFKQIDISNPRNLVVHTFNSLKIYMGEGDFAHKLSRLVRVLDDLSRRGKTAEVVDLRFKDVVVQPLSVKAERALEKSLQSGANRLPVIRIEGR